MDTDSNPDYQVCCSCGSKTELEFGPDPYAEDIGGDDTPVWECSECRENSALNR